MLATLLGSSALWTGCSGKKATEYVAGFSTQAHLPRDLQSIIIRVDSGGQNYFTGDYPVYDGTVRLPKTFGVFKQNIATGAPVTISVYGFNVNDVNGAGAQSNYGAFNTAAVQAPTVGTKEHDVASGGGAKILRSSRQPYVEGQILYLPMPLHYSCFDVDCGPIATQNDPKLGPLCSDGSCTCKGGLCVAPDTDPTTLPPYSDDLIYGSTNTCFRPFSDKDTNGNTQPGCMDWGIPPQVIDEKNCIYALPGSPSVPADAGVYDPTGFLGPYITAADQGGGLNVRVVFDNVVSEVLDYEGACTGAGQPPPAGVQEGYCVFQDAPQRFQLAPGLCAMKHGDPSAAHVVTLMETSAACLPKTAFQPICDDSIQGPPQPTLADGGSADNPYCGTSYDLTPAASALYVLFDTSSGMREFVGNAGAAQALSLSLQDPVFQKTQVGMKFLPAQSTDCSSSSFSNLTSLDVPFEDSVTAQADIATKLETKGPGDGGSAGLPPGSGPWYLEGALKGAYDALLSLPNSKQMNRRAVMLFIDRDFNISPNPDCAGHLDAITEAANAVSAQDPSTQIETYVVLLANADFPEGGVPGNPVSDATQLARGLTPGNSYFFDATQGAQAAAVAVEALGSVVADMGSCVYEPTVRGAGPSPAVIGPDWTLTFADRTGSSTVTATSTTDCTAADAAGQSAWGYNNQHIQLCPATCNRLVNSIKAEEAITAALNAQNPSRPPAPAQGVKVQAIAPAFFCDAGIAPTDAAIVESGIGPAQPPPNDAGTGGGDAGGTGGLDASTD